MRVFLRMLRGLILVKRYGTPILQKLFQPFVSVGFILLKVIGVPLYRGFFFVKRSVSQILLPAKHRFFYLLSNRYSIHVFMIFFVACIAWANIKTQHVRAETFGQQSELYALVSVDDSQTLEVVEAGKEALIFGGPSSYIADAILNTQGDIDTDTGEETDLETPFVPARDAVETYVVQEGDSLGKIAVKFGLSISTMLSANNLSLRSTIRPGDTLKILPSDGVLYSVVRGDTVSKIARLYSIKEEEIVRVNKLGGNASLQIGAELLLPGAQARSTVSAIVRRPVSVKDIFVPSGPTTASGWVWPTNWHVITQYFSWKHSGIDIDGDYSTFSLASHEGVVSFTGWRKGYGLTVEVDHGNGLKTRYAHNSKIFVSPGDVVQAGESLAQTGSTGRSTGTHLHFEVIKNGKFQNPLDYVR